jgi:hypothetical protein
VGIDCREKLGTGLARKVDDDGISSLFSERFDIEDDSREKVEDDSLEKDRALSFEAKRKGLGTVSERAETGLAGIDCREKLGTGLARKAADTSLLSAPVFSERFDIEDDSIEKVEDDSLEKDRALSFVARRNGLGMVRGRTDIFDL